MDIELLSKMVRELILDKDEVTLHGVGSFVAEFVPATFSDKGYTINPPYRRLTFRQRENPEDHSLEEFYAISNGIDKDKASKILLEFLTELGNVVKEKKSITFPGLGRLRATKENNLFFICDEDLDIYPEGFGLEPLSLKNHSDAPEGVPAQEDIQVPAQPEKTEKREKAGGRSVGNAMVRAVIWLLVAAIAALVIFLILAQIAPDFIDDLLYNEEELELLRKNI